METLKKLVDQNIEEVQTKGYAVVNIKESEELKELADKINYGIILASTSRLKALIKSYIERVENQKEIINLLLSKLTELATEKLEEENLGGARWDYFFGPEERRKIIDSIISEDKSRKPLV